jgi:hypothetical protein
MSALRTLLKTGFWRPVSRVTRSFHLLPPTATLLVIALLINSGQVREIYLSSLESDQTYIALPLLFAIVTFGLFSATLFTSHFWLSPVQDDVVYANPAGLPGIADYVGLRRYTALALSLLPWVALAVGFLTARSSIEPLRDSILEMAKPFAAKIVTSGPNVGQPIIQPTVTVMIDALDSLHFWTSVGAAVAMTVGVAIAFLLDRVLLRNRRNGSSRLACGVAIAVLGFIVAAAGAPSFFENPITAYRTIGSLAVIAIAILFFYTIAALLAYLSREARYQPAGLPVLSLTLIAVGICLYGGVATEAIAKWGCVISFVLAVLATFLRLEVPIRLLLVLLGVIAFGIWKRELIFVKDALSVTNGVSATVDPTHPLVRNTDLTDKFGAWFAARRDRDKWISAARPYPVFVIAVEGGGIYAAAAASGLLARLQDRCPAFAQHVFAISGVSGGSVGASLFEAAIKSVTQTDQVTCDTSLFSNGPLEAKLAQIVLDDHFSPVVGSIVPDLIGQPWDRAKGLEESFMRSVSRIDSVAGGIVSQNFSQTWSAENAVPALILNSTWADNGIRVAFSPFALSGEAPVYSFFDCKILGDAIATTSLMDAAITSARFPGILPPYSVLRHSEVAKLPTSSPNGVDACPSDVMAPGTADRVERWNFVDGAYSDSSGAATALDVYQVIEAYQAVTDPSGSKGGLDLQLILLTGAPPSADYSDVNGTNFRDLVAPINAILNVRTQLANQSVERALNYFKNKSGASDGANDGAASTLPSAVKLIRLRDDLFGLSLGWRISHATFNLVSALVGRADICVDNLSADIFPASKALNDNSCTLRAIERLLKMKPE